MKIEPALTAEEWEQFEARKLDLYSYFVDDSRPHAIAAASLYGQPFGFTREDVMDVRAAAQMLAYRLPEIDVGPSETRTAVGRLNSLADRMEALLPPNALDTTAFTP